LNSTDSQTCTSRSTRRAFALNLTLAALLAGCATQTAAPPAASSLTTEQRWLEEWFRGTPVVIALHDANTLAVDVPLANSFAAGSSSVKSALAAVLDRVAESLRRQPALRISLSAPTDSDGKPALAASRTQQLSEQLIARGVAATRTTGLGTARAGAAVQLRLVAVAPQVVRLDDATLPPLTPGAPRTGSGAASSAKR
jgi:outer membrane protein OmpA-like peptidoglycan-associated protein